VHEVKSIRFVAGLEDKVRMSCVLREYGVHDFLSRPIHILASNFFPFRIHLTGPHLESSRYLDTITMPENMGLLHPFVILVICSRKLRKDSPQKNYKSEFLIACYAITSHSAFCLCWFEG
jgi:hypothetical protein